MDLGRKRGFDLEEPRILTRRATSGRQDVAVRDADDEAEEGGREHEILGSFLGRFWGTQGQIWKPLEGSMPLGPSHIP